MSSEPLFIKVMAAVIILVAFPLSFVVSRPWHAYGPDQERRRDRKGNFEYRARASR